MKYNSFRFDQITINCDKKRIPLSSIERAKRQGIYRYYGAQGVIDHIDDYIFDGTYMLIAEDGENLKSKKQNIAQLVTGKFWVNNHAHIIQSNESCDLRFLYYLINSIDLSGYITGSAQPKLSQNNLNTLVLQIPELIIQQKIVGILSSLDDKIELNNRINENLEQQASLLFNQWLKDCTESITIGELSSNILDYSPVSNEMVRLLNSSDVTEGIFPFSPFVPNKKLKGHFKKHFKFGDILYSEIRPRNHHYGLVLFDASEYIASTRLMVIRAIQEKVSPFLLYQYLLLPDVEAEFTLKTESRSGTFPQGNYADMATIAVPYVPLELQVSISNTLSQFRYMIVLNQLENQKLAELRDSLLPRLMSGELDVSDIDL